MADLNGRGIGLIADSHGNLDATAEAIRLLKGRGADILVHLGDFCDSVRRDRAGAMIASFCENSVLAVKGNNDFFVESVLTDERRSPDPEGEPASPSLRPYPSLAHSRRLCFSPILSPSTRSGPSMNRSTRAPPSGRSDSSPRRISGLLFCGHSHLPVLFRKAGSRVTREQVPPGEKLVLGGAMLITAACGTKTMSRGSLHRDRRRGGRRGVRPLRP